VALRCIEVSLPFGQCVSFRTAVFTAVIAVMANCSLTNLHAGSILDWQPEEFDQIEGFARPDQPFVVEQIDGIGVGAGEAIARSDHSRMPINPMTGWPVSFGIYGTVVVQTTLDSGSTKKVTDSDGSESGLIWADSIHNSLRVLGWMACIGRPIPPRGIPIELLRPPNLEIAISI